MDCFESMLFDQVAASRSSQSVFLVPILVKLGRRGRCTVLDVDPAKSFLEVLHQITRCTRKSLLAMVDLRIGSRRVSPHHVVSDYTQAGGDTVFLEVWQKQIGGMEPSMDNHASDEDIMQMDENGEGSWEMFYNAPEENVSRRREDIHEDQILDLMGVLPVTDDDKRYGPKNKNPKRTDLPESKWDPHAFSEESLDLFSEGLHAFVFGLSQFLFAGRSNST